MARVPDITRPPRPFQVAQFTPSGILPGEEQVTTMQTFAQLTPEEQRALRGRVPEGGPLSFDETMSANYDDLPPDERLASMRKSAQSAPRVNIGVDPSLPPGKNTELAKSRVRAGKPLPEGREPSQYTPAQRAEMTRNWERPEVPMQRFGGTYTKDVTGSMKIRAPNPEKVRLAESIAADPEQGPDSFSYWAAVGDALGMDVSRYGDDLDMLRGDAQVELDRHASLGERFDVRPMGGGVFVYVPNAGTQAQLDQRRREQKVDQMLGRHWERPEMSDARLAEMADAERSPEGMDRLRSLSREIYRDNLARRSQNVNDNRANYNLSMQMNSPRLAPGMAVRSLQQALRDGSPLGMSIAYDIMGNPLAARDMRVVAMNQQNAERDIIGAQQQLEAQQQAETNRQQEANRTLADQIEREIGEALALSPDEAMSAVVAIVDGLPQYKGLDLAIKQRVAREMIASRLASSSPTDPRVQAHLMTLASDPPRFMQFVLTHNMAKSPDEASALLSQFSKSPEQRGRDAADSVSAGVRGIAGFGRGLLAGLGLGSGSPPPPTAQGGADPPIVLPPEPSAAPAPPPPGWQNERPSWWPRSPQQWGMGG